MMYEAVGVNTNFPHTKYGLHSNYHQKIALTFECSDGETIYTFHLYNLTEKHNWHRSVNV